MCTVHHSTLQNIYYEVGWGRGLLGQGLADDEQENTNKNKQEKEINLKYLENKPTFFLLQ
jgi:hypothetical protein